MRALIIGSAILMTGIFIMGFLDHKSRDSNVVSHNLSYAADKFQIDRRVIFYNGITGEYMLNIEGKCSISHGGGQLEVTCKVGKDLYKKHFLGLSDNVTYFVEHLEPKGVSKYHYAVSFKPQSIFPDVDFQGKVGNYEAQ